MFVEDDGGPDVDAVEPDDVADVVEVVDVEDVETLDGLTLNVVDDPVVVEVGLITGRPWVLETEEVIDVVMVGVDEVGDGLLGRGTAGVGAGFGDNVGDSVVRTGIAAGLVAEVWDVDVAELMTSVNVCYLLAW